MGVDSHPRSLTWILSGSIWTASLRSCLSVGWTLPQISPMEPLHSATENISTWSPSSGDLLESECESKSQRVRERERDGNRRREVSREPKYASKQEVTDVL